MKKLMLGLLIAFAVTAEAAVTIDGFKYELNTGNKTASLTGYEGSPTKVDVSEVEWGGERYTVTSVGVSAFDGCSSLASVELPNATMIGGSAFEGCPLTSVSLPNATTIELGAFHGCSSLASVSLPLVTAIGASAFLSCNALSSLVVNVEMKSAIETNGRPYYGISSGTTITYYDGLPYSIVKAAEYEMALRSGDILLDTDEYKRACEVFGITPKTEPQVVGADEIAVKKESIQSPSAGTVTVEANKVQLGVTILKTSDLTAEKKDWGEVTLTADDVKVVDGKIVISVPVDSASGFMILQSKDAKVNNVPNTIIEDR